MQRTYSDSRANKKSAYTSAHLSTSRSNLTIYLHFTPSYVQVAPISDQHGPYS